MLALRHKYFVKSYIETSISHSCGHKEDIMQVTEQCLLSVGKQGD